MDEKTINCPIHEELNAGCSCPKTDCPHHGLCCRCIASHKQKTDVELIKRFPHCLREMVQEALDT